MRRVKKIKRELKRLNKLAKKRIQYLYALRGQDQYDREITELMQPDNTNIRTVNNMLKGLNTEEAKKEVEEMKNHYRGVVELTEHMKEYINEKT